MRSLLLLLVAKCWLPANCLASPCTADRLTLGTSGCRYIEYEKQVEALRVARKRSRKLDGKPSLADHAGVRRVHFVFERATRKVPGRPAAVDAVAALLPRKQEHPAQFRG